MRKACESLEYISKRFVCWTAFTELWSEGPGGIDELGIFLGVFGKIGKDEQLVRLKWPRESVEGSVPTRLRAIFWNFISEYLHQNR